MKAGPSIRQLHRIFRIALICSAVLCLALPGTRGLFATAAGQAEQEIALVGGTVIDGNGGAPIPDGVVVIKGNRIAHVGSKGKTRYPKSAKVIDVSGKYVMPGLIDMHVHYRSWMGEMFLANGVTTVKDLGNDLEWISTMSEDVNRGRARGPRIFYVGDGLDAPPPARETHVAVDNPLMARRAVALEHERGASAIKVREKITLDLLRAITEEAHRLNMRVSGHLRSLDAREAASAGIDGLEHATGIVQALSDYPRTVDPAQKELQTVISDLKAFSKIDMQRAPELVSFLVSKKVALIPTLSGWWRMVSDRRDEFALQDVEYARNANLAYVPEDMRKIWTASAIYKLKSPEDFAAISSGYKNLQEILRLYQKAGGKVLAGSDTLVSVPGLSLQRELLFLVDAGFTPAQAISIATRENAEFLGMGGQLGVISPGTLADILIVSANPLADVRNAQRVSMVLKDGKIVDTGYHAGYSVPTPEPKITRPTWLDRQLQRYAGDARR